MTFDVKPIPPIVPMSTQEVHDSELLHIITTTIRSCGISGEDVGIKLAEVLKKIGRNDLVSSCFQSADCRKNGEIQTRTLEASRCTATGKHSCCAEELMALFKKGETE